MGYGKGISKPLFDKLYSTLIKVLKDPATREVMERQGADPMTSTPAEMLALINAEYARFT